MNYDKTWQFLSIKPLKHVKPIDSNDQKDRNNDPDSSKKKLSLLVVSKFRICKKPGIAKQELKRSISAH